MRAGEPDPVPEPDQPASSLLQRLGAAARGVRLRGGNGEGERPPASEWKLAAALALLIAGGPLLTWGGAELLRASVARETAKLGRQMEPRLARAEAARVERSQLAAAIGRPTLGATLDALARALPADASLVRVERDARGLLTADVATPDPDRLRAALREEPALALLRDAGQREGDTNMIVSLAEVGP